MALHQSSSSATSLSPPDASQSSDSAYFSTLNGCVHDPQRASPLFGLPQSVRERIYRHALSSPRLVQWPADDFQLHLALPLILTCRRIYQEAAPILYSANRFLFLHPSDLNMFVNIADRRYARAHLEEVFLRIRDREVRLWTGYLGSTTIYRSLQYDVPNLTSLHIWFRTMFWSPEPAEGFMRWAADPALESLCGTMQDKTPQFAKVQVVCVHRIAKQDVEDLLSSYGEQLRQKANGDVRTQFRKVHGVDVCLELTPVDIPGPGDLTLNNTQTAQQQQMET